MKAAFLSLLFLVSSAHADTALRPGQKEFPPASQERLDQVASSFVKEEDLPDTLSIESAVDPQLVTVWEGNKGEVEAEFRRISLYFSEKGEEGPGTLFPIQMTIDRDGVTLPHSIGRLSKHDPAPGSIAKGKKKIIGLATNSGGFAEFAIGVAKGESGRATGVLICPRPKVLGSEGMRLVGARFEAAANAKGKMLSGIGPGLARAEILTSPNMPAPREWTDKKLAPDANIALRYTPVDDFSPKIGEPMDGIVGGIEATLDLTNYARYRRITTVREIATAHWVTLDGKQSGEFAGHEYEGAPLRCYVLLVDRQHEEHYEQVPQEPAKAKGSPK